jgi:hypothetical protein
MKVLANAFTTGFGIDERLLKKSQFISGNYLRLIYDSGSSRYD